MLLLLPLIVVMHVVTLVPGGTYTTSLTTLLMKKSIKFTLGYSFNYLHKIPHIGYRNADLAIFSSPGEKFAH